MKILKHSVQLHPGKVSKAIRYNKSKNIFCLNTCIANIYLRNRYR